jgi:hypothetical protein
MRITKCQQSLLAKTTLLTVLAMMPVAVATAGSTHDLRDIASVLASNTSASEVSSPSKSPVQLKDGRLSVSVVKLDALVKLCIEAKKDPADLCKFFRLDALESITFSVFKKAKRLLENKIAKAKVSPAPGAPAEGAAA